ncbi:hypothetical protein P154DRAFT_141671 [Amniculicola lignicola CBS 123094]|uniref:Uncharacterized protein n=1 Tax=Amniculicola lignicola CBS 123094 TaxID=1392246 RepID=A0A6A5WL16_9PLEO|nr:hypothetical protein P154DRAFT_141671 [Amniculicola lignicola CBS 123094]
MRFLHRPTMQRTSYYVTHQSRLGCLVFPLVLLVSIYSKATLKRNSPARIFLPRRNRRKRGRTRTPTLHPGFSKSP